MSTRPSGPGAAVRSTAPKVSVVVPVYNPGPYLQRCVDSILGQSLPPGELEAIFVDDGSTDDSGARLDAIAARHPHVRVIHQPNSGWPGKPRNVGIDAARGDYVFFVDADDALGPEALERLHAMAVPNGSDIVVGRVVGHRRSAPREVFAADRDRATLWDAPLVDTLTVHKLFRRAFLVDHGLRFPEGRRRLEDLAFTLPAYFAAATISILASYPCYYLYWRDDFANISHGRVDPGYYFGFLREILGIVESNTEPGPRRDALLQRFARLEMLDRLRGRMFLESSDEYRVALLREVCSVVADHIPPTVDLLLPPLPRTRLALVRADRLDLLVELAESEAGVTARAAVLEWRATGKGALELRLEVGLDRGQEPVRLEERDGLLLLPVPERVAAVVPIEARVVDPGAPRAFHVLARRTDDSTEHVAATLGETAVAADVDPVGAIRRTVTATIDPRRLAGGAPPSPGRWNIVVRGEAHGYNREGRAGLPDGPRRVPGPQRLVSTPAWSAEAAWLDTPPRLAVLVAKGPWRPPWMRLPGRVVRRLGREIRGIRRTPNRRRDTREPGGRGAPGGPRR